MEKPKKHVCRCKKVGHPVRETCCKVCGVPILFGRLDRSIHKKCEEVYYKDYRDSWYKKNQPREKAKRVVYSRRFRKENPEKRLWNGAAQRAKDKGLPFNIDLSDIVIPEFCPVLLERLEVGTDLAPSLDKIVPDLGYVKGNVQVISKKANLMKQNATEEELRRFAEWVKKTYL